MNQSISIQARNVLFTSEERAEFLKKEPALIEKAKANDIAPLIKFWKEKKELMINRATCRAERVVI